MYIISNAQKLIPFHYSKYSTHISNNNFICHPNIYFTNKCIYNMKGVHTHLLNILQENFVHNKTKVQRFSCHVTNRLYTLWPYALFNIRYTEDYEND